MAATCSTKCRAPPAPSAQRRVPPGFVPRRVSSCRGSHRQSGPDSSPPCPRSFRPRWQTPSTPFFTRHGPWAMATPLLPVHRVVPSRSSSRSLSSTPKGEEPRPRRPTPPKPPPHATSAARSSSSVNHPLAAAPAPSPLSQSTRHESWCPSSTPKANTGPIRSLSSIPCATMLLGTLLPLEALPPPFSSKPSLSYTPTSHHHPPPFQSPSPPLHSTSQSARVRARRHDTRTRATAALPRATSPRPSPPTPPPRSDGMPPRSAKPACESAASATSASAWPGGHRSHHSRRRAASSDAR